MIDQLVSLLVALIRAGIASGRPEADIRAEAHAAIAHALAGDTASVAAMHAEWRGRIEALWPVVPTAPRAYVGDSVYPPDEVVP